jgi:DNA-directed RNA polymerase specialized sigma24 family protein
MFTDAEDLVQETMLRSWRAQASYAPSTGELGLQRWLYRIATDAALDFLRSATHRASVSSRVSAELPWLQPYPDTLLDELPLAQQGPDAADSAKETIAEPTLR